MATTLRVPRAKTRLHVNPLSPELLCLPPPTPDWPEAVSDASLPLHLDLGCAYGELSLLLAERDGRTNRVGVDLRERPLQRGAALCDEQAARLGRRSAHVLLANARHPLFLQSLLRGYEGPLACVSVLFPDPFGSRSRPQHANRRLLQPELVHAVAEAMAPDGCFVTATDNPEMAEEHAAPFEADRARWRGGRVDASPFAPVVTAWEGTVAGRRSPTFWTVYHRV